MIRRLAHICFETTDLTRLVKFYTDIMGMKAKFDFTNSDGEVFGYYIDCGDSSFIELFDRDLRSKQWGGGQAELVMGTQYKHFCLEVTGLKDYRDLLVERGAEVGEIRTGMDGSLQAWLKDADGNPIELMEYTFVSWQLR